MNATYRSHDVDDNNNDKDDDEERNLWEESNRASKAMVVPWMRATLREVAIQGVRQCLVVTTADDNRPTNSSQHHEQDPTWKSNNSSKIVLELTQEDLKDIEASCQLVASVWAQRLEAEFHVQAASWLRELVEQELSTLFGGGGGDEEQRRRMVPAAATATTRTTAPTPTATQTTTTDRIDNRVDSKKEQGALTTSIDQFTTTLPLVQIRKLVECPLWSSSMEIDSQKDPHCNDTTNHDTDCEVAEDPNLEPQMLQQAIATLDDYGTSGSTHWPYDWSTTIVPATRQIPWRLYPTSPKPKHPSRSPPPDNNAHHNRIPNRKVYGTAATTTKTTRDSPPFQNSATATTRLEDDTRTSGELENKEQEHQQQQQQHHLSPDDEDDDETGQGREVPEYNAAAVDWLLQRKRKSRVPKRRRRDADDDGNNNKNSKKQTNTTLALPPARPPSTLSHETWRWSEIRSSIMTEAQVRQCLHMFLPLDGEENNEEQETEHAPKDSNSLNHTTTVQSGVLLGSLSDYGWQHALDRGQVALLEETVTKDQNSKQTQPTTHPTGTGSTRHQIRAQRRCIQERLGGRIQGWESDYGSARRLRASSKVVQTMTTHHRSGSSSTSGLLDESTTQDDNHHSATQSQNSYYCLEADLVGGCNLLDLEQECTETKAPPNDSTAHQQLEPQHLLTTANKPKQRTLHAFSYIQLIATDLD
ncbi:hypothetical protein ACA910_010157 [Epithemia clementina (nom. ined.)]